MMNTCVGLARTCSKGWLIFCGRGNFELRPKAPKSKKGLEPRKPWAGGQKPPRERKTQDPLPTQHYRLNGRAGTLVIPGVGGRARKFRNPILEHSQLAPSWEDNNLAPKNKLTKEEQLIINNKCDKEQTALKFQKVSPGSKDMSYVVFRKSHCRRSHIGVSLSKIYQISMFFAFCFSLDTCSWMHWGILL